MNKLDIPFDNPATYRGHSGVDYAQRAGTPFRASDNGVVVSLGFNSRGGYYIWVSYDSIAFNVGYHHMPSHDACPARGSRFNYGDQLGVVGNTGNSTGPHLHSEVAGHATTEGYWKFFNRDKVIGATVKPSAKAKDKKEKKVMKGLAYDENGTTKYMLFNEVSGFHVEHSGVNPGEYNNPIARMWETGSWPTVTKAHADVIRAELDRVRARK